MLNLTPPTQSIAEHCVGITCPIYLAGKRGCFGFSNQ